VGNWFSRAAAPVVERVRRIGFLSGERTGRKRAPRRAPAEIIEATAAASLRELAADAARGGSAFAADSASIKAGFGLSSAGVPPALLEWYASQSFIGYQSCALLSQHWLIAKCCGVPARDAVRVGYEVVADDGELPEDIAKRMQRADKRHRIREQMVEFVEAGRTYGIRIAFARVETDDPVAYYEAPFNADGIAPGSYRGIVQVDPQWCSPVLDNAGASDPASPHYYEPTWWIIGGRKYHRSHLIIYRHGYVPDMLKPMYRYGGVPVPQRVMERVYGAERTANEAPELVMTKRLTTMGIDAEAALADMEAFEEGLANFARLRNNYGVKTHDKEAEQIQQFDTALSDLDAVIMTQYQLVAAAANIPATKLLGTTPKGFNATGDYEEASYHEELESIQAHDLTRLLERHHLCVMRSEIAPKLADGTPVATSVVWNPLDSPTSAEVAATQKILAERDAVLAGIGAIDGMDVRDRLARDEDSGYYGVEIAERGDDGEGDGGEGP
jgi:phage-related protein (TIGR01555 family)